MKEDTFHYRIPRCRLPDPNSRLNSVDSSLCQNVESVCLFYALGNWQVPQIYLLRR